MYDCHVGPPPQVSLTRLLFFIQMAPIVSHTRRQLPQLQNLLFALIIFHSQTPRTLTGGYCVYVQLREEKHTTDVVIITSQELSCPCSTRCSCVVVVGCHSGLQLCYHQWSLVALSATTHHDSYCNSIALLVDEMKQVKPLQLFHDLVKTNQNGRGRLIGLDVGEKYVGLALSDFDNKIASPFSVLVRKKTNISLMASDFESLISKYSLKGFVIGLPFDRHRVSSDAVRVKVFIDDLRRTKMFEGLKYTYWNECFTSKNVELLLKPLNLNNPVHSKTMSDKFAAVGILQGYLDYVNRKTKFCTGERLLISV